MGDIPLNVFTYQHLADWLLGFVLLSLMVERSLFQVFQTKLWKSAEFEFDKRLNKQFSTTQRDYADLKPWLSAGVCIAIAISLDLDFAGFLFDKPAETWRMVITGLLLSGGSTALVWIFKRGRELKDAAHEVKLDNVKKSNKAISNAASPQSK